MTRSDFKIVLNNVSGEKKKAADPLAPYYIQYFAAEETKYVSISGDGCSLCLVEKFEEKLNFKSEDQAERRLMAALDGGDFSG